MAGERNNTVIDPPLTGCQRLLRSRPEVTGVNDRGHLTALEGGFDVDRPGLLRRRVLRGCSLALALSLVAAACGGSSDNGGGDDESGGGDGEEVDALQVPEDSGEPVSGGELTYYLEAETNGGYCLAEAQLAISGVQVARSVYDTLTAPNADGEYVPFLAESVESNEDFTEWTITIREGIKFHNDTDLTAEVVKNNLDAYRGQNPVARLAAVPFRARQHHCCRGDG